MKLSEPMVDWMVRRRYGNQLRETPFDRFRVCVARTREAYEDAFRLIYVGYVFRGILSASDDPSRFTPQHLLPEATTFVAYEGEHMVGTMTVTVDSPAGLPLDEDYGAQLTELRQQGARLVEFGSLTVVQRCWKDGVTSLLNMAAYAFASSQLGATHCVIGVDPRVVPLYRALYNFHPVGEPKQHTELCAPVQALVQEMPTVLPILRRVGHHRVSGLTMDEHFTSSPPSCVELPPHWVSAAELARWKLPRQVFRDLFVTQAGRLASLDAKTREHLDSWRSIGTTGFDQLRRSA